MNDGGEVDLDLGNYERYLNVTLSRDNNITTGKIYREVIEKEVGRFLRRLSRNLPFVFVFAEKRGVSGQDGAGKRLFDSISCGGLKIFLSRDCR